MKKFLGIATGILFFVLLVLMVLPFLFKDKVMELAKTEGNKMIEGYFDFSSLDMSFIRNFPQATIILNDFYIVGDNEFANDTLVSVKKANVTVNIMSLLTGSDYEIEKIELDSPRINAIVLDEGEANWDIMAKDNADNGNEVQTTSSPFSLRLNKLEINNAGVAFHNRQNGMKVGLQGVSLWLKGNLAAEKSAIETRLAINRADFAMGNISYLNRARFEAEVSLDADLKENYFLLKKNRLLLNAIETSIEGWVRMPEDAVEMDLTLNTSKVQFKEILSLVPAMYTKDFEKIKTDGKVTLSATAKGTMKGEQLPTFDIDLQVNDAMFRYPSLPKSLDDIQLSLKVNNPGGVMDQTKVVVDRFHFNLGGNPFDARFSVFTPISDPEVLAEAKGYIDLMMVREVYPLDDMELEGNVTADLSIAGKYSYVQQEQYDRFKADGSLKLQNMQLAMQGIPSFYIDNMLMKFSPQYVDLSETKLTFGKNDLVVAGRLENMLGYVMKGETLKGRLQLNSNHFNLNDFMTTDTEQGKTAGDSATADSIQVMEVPRNIDFNMDATFGEIVFQKLVLSNSKGNLRIKDGKLSINGLQTNSLGGSLRVDGYYSTARNAAQPDLHFALDMRNVSFVETFKAFDMVQQLAPIFGNVTGTYSANLNLNTPLGRDFMPLLQELTADGRLLSQNVTVKGVKAMEAMAATLKNDRLKEIVAKDLNLPFSVKQGRVYTDPFDLKMGDIKMNLSGSTGLDQTVDYIAVVNMPSGAKTGGLLSTVNLKIGGTFSDVDIKIDTESLAKEALNNVKDKLTDKLQNLLGGDNDENKVSDSSDVKKTTDDAAKELKKKGLDLINKLKKK